MIDNLTDLGQKLDRKREGKRRPKKFNSMTSDPVVSVVELAGQYKREFENGLSKLVKHAATFANSTSKARTYEQFNVFHRELLKRRDELIVKIQDTQSTLSDLDTATLMRAFSWMAVMLLGLNFGAFLGGILFSSLLEFFISDHAKLLCLTIGGGFILHLSLGAIIDLSVPYLLLAGLYGFIGFAILQLYVNNAGKDIAITHMYQFSFVYAVIFSQALIYVIFGLDAKELANTAPHSSLLSFL
uniref:Uncharacterized protein n=1 Tax=Wuchereria bancrofti TaxID=6293 RepID=A0A1I8EYA4_WUCBA